MDKKYLVSSEDFNKYKELEYEKTNSKDLGELKYSSEDDGSWDIFDYFYLEKIVGLEDSDEDVYMEDMNTKDRIYASKLEKNDKNIQDYMIDFGTRSTVALGSDPDINNYVMKKLVRIGSENEKTTSETMKSYENPTILKFSNVDNFKKEYNKRKSRPFTKYRDIVSSFEPREEINEISKYVNTLRPIYFDNIKQWTTNSKKFKLLDEYNLDKIGRNEDYEHIRIPLFDKVDIESLKKDSRYINPLTIYSYLLGTRLHNNKTKKIAKNYYMTVPTTVKNDIRNKIALYFQEGLKKNFPIHVIENPEYNKKDDKKAYGKVEIITTEPTAYAVAAFDLYEELRGDETYFYSVFDFGGGTSDYTFGLKKNSTVKESKLEEVKDAKKIYLQTLFTYGDNKLGGENIIKALVDEFVMSNIDIFEENKIVVRSFLEETPSVVDRVVNDESEISTLNNVILMSFMRPIWENYNDIIDYIDGSIELEDGSKKDKLERCKEFIENKKGEIQLFTTENTTTPKTVIVNFNIERLEKVLFNTIRKGVYNFLVGLKTSLDIIKNKETLSDIISKSDKVFRDSYAKTKFSEVINSLDILGINDLKKVIILGGHSSESPLFREILDKELENFGFRDEFTIVEPLKISEEINEICQKEQCSPSDIVNNSILSKYSKDLLEKMRMTHNFDATRLPNSKTGVVYGLNKIINKKYAVFEKTVKKYDIPFIYNITDPNFKKSYLNFMSEGKNTENRENIKYGEWVKYKDVPLLDNKFPVYLTTIQWQGEKPEYISREVVELNKSVFEIRFDSEEFEENYDEDELDDVEVSVYIRATEPDTIEYYITDSKNPKEPEAKALVNKQNEYRIKGLEGV